MELKFDHLNECDINELEQAIPILSKYYYEGKKILTDFEFDTLIDRLRNEKPNSKILNMIGWGYHPNTGKEARHLLTLTTIDVKLKDKEKLKPFTGKYILTPKLDGGSVMLYYKLDKFDKNII